MIRRALQIATLLSVIAVVASCVRPGGAPLSARKAIPDSAEGLMQLYRQECLEVRNRRWIRDESARFIARCPWFLVRESTRSNCIDSEDGRVSWRVPTKSGSSVEIKMAWPTAWAPPGPPEGRLKCEIYIVGRLGEAFRIVAPEAAKAEGMSAGPWRETIAANERTNGWESWTWSHEGGRETGPWVQLVHYPAGSAPDEWKLSYTTPGDRRFP